MSDKTKSFLVVFGAALVIWFLLHLIGYAQLPVLSSAHYRYNGSAVLNDITATPGAIRPEATQAQLCDPTFRTGSVRNVSDSLKAKVYKEYEVTPTGDFCKGGCEVDHLIPLTNGGSNDITNLWIQPSQPLPGYHQKDVLEVWSHKQMCQGKLTLDYVQKQTANDWVVLYNQMLQEKNKSNAVGVKNGGGGK